MEIKIIEVNKRDYLDLLLLADEQEDMIDKYLDRGSLFTLYENNELKSCCVVTDEGDDVFEVQNLATYEQHQQKGYGSYLLNYVCRYYQKLGRVMYVGTGNSQCILSFYEKNGFKFSHNIENYFLKHYSNPMFVNGIQLKDKIYLKRNLQ